MSFVYRYILKRAWSITWKNKWLWIFGLFAATLGNGGSINILINGLDNVQMQASFLANLKILFSSSTIGEAGNLISQFFQNLTIYYTFLFILIIIAFIVILYLAITTQGALLISIYNIYKNKQAGLKKGFEVGKKKFWSIFAANLSGKLLVYLIFFILSIPFLFLYLKYNNILWQLVMLVVGFIVFVPFAVIVSFLVKYAVLYLVVENLTFKESVKKAWILFKNNWLVSLEIAVILFVINVVAAAVVIFSYFFIAMPFIALVYLSFQMGIEFMFWIGIIGGSALLLVVIFLLGAILSTYQSAVWVLVFNQLNESVVISKIQRLAAKASSIFVKRI